MGKPSTKGQEAAAREQAAAIERQSQITRDAANESARQSAAQIALAQSRAQVAEQIEATNASNAQDEAEVNLSDAAGATETLTRKRARFQVPTDPSASIRI